MTIDVNVQPNSANEFKIQTHRDDERKGSH
jgi:hypothetical protein